MFYTNKNRFGVAARHVGNDNAHKTNKQTFPNKQSPTRVANDTKINNISVSARRKDGSKTQCAVPRLPVVLEGGSLERVTVAQDKSHFGGSGAPGDRRTEQTTGQTTRIRKRVSSSRLRSNCDENSGLCQVLAPSNIDRSKKVRDYIVSRSVGNRFASPRHGGDHDRATTVQKKGSPSVQREGKSVLCNITQSRNLQQSAKSFKVEAETHRRSCHPLEQRLTYKPLHTSDVNILRNGNTQKSNGSRCLSKNGLSEKNEKFVISGIENGKIVSPVVERRSPGVCPNSNQSSCKKKSRCGEKKMEKVFLNHSSNLAMESAEKTVSKTKRRLRGSKIAVLSKSSGQRKSISSQRQGGRDSDTVNTSSRSHCPVVSGHRSVSASLPGNLLEAEITDLDRNGTDCKASRRREIGDEERCAGRAGNIAGLSEEKVFHSLQVHTPGGGVAGSDEDTLADTIGGNTAGGQTTLRADDNTAQHVARADSVQLSRKICQRSQDCAVIVRDKRNGRKKRENSDCCVVRQDCDSSDVITVRGHGMTTALEYRECAHLDNSKSGRTLNNGESAVYDPSDKLSQTGLSKQGNISITNQVADLRYDHFDDENESLFSEENSNHLSVDSSFHDITCFSNDELDDVATAQVDDFRVCEITEKTSGNEVKATKRQKQISCIPSYQGNLRQGKVSNVKNKKLLKREKDFANGRPGSDEIRCSKSSVKSERYDSQVPFLSANECSTGSKSLKHKTKTAETLESETKTVSARECKDTDSRIPEKTELLLISDHVSYLVSIPEGSICSQTNKNLQPADDVICKSYAPENLAGADAEKSLEASGKGIPLGSVSVGDKERKGVSSSSQRSLGLSNTEVKYHNPTEQYSGDVNNGLHSQLVTSHVERKINGHLINYDSDSSSQNARNYGVNSTSVGFYNSGGGISEDNAHILSNDNDGSGYARCVTDQSALECVADQNSIMATKSSGPLREKGTVPSKHKGERLKRQIGQASLEINLAEKVEESSGGKLPDSVPGKRKHDSASTSRLMRPTISSAIRSSPEMAKKLIPKMRSPTSPDTMFSPPLERKNRDRRKKENSGKVKNQVASGDIVAHKPPLDKTTCSKVSSSPRSSVSSTDVSVRSGISEKVSETTDPHSSQKHRKGANKTKSGSSISPRMHSGASADSSSDRSKRCGTLKLGELSELEVEGRAVLISNKQSGGGESSFLKDNQESDGVNSVSEADDKSEKTEHRDVKIEKTRKNVETYESGVDATMDSNRSSSERECHSKPKFDRSSSSSPISNDSSLQVRNAKGGKTKVSRNAQGKRKGEPALKNNLSEVKDVGRKSVPVSVSTSQGQKTDVKGLSVKEKDGANVSENENVEKEILSDSVQRSSSISPTSSVTSVGLKSVKSSTKFSKSVSNNYRNLKMERVPSRVSLNGAIRKKGTENKSTSPKSSAVSEDRLKKDKAKTVKKMPSASDVKKADSRTKKVGSDQRVPASQAPSNQLSQSERSVSNSPRSSILDDDTDSGQSLSSAVSKTNKPVSRLPKVSKLPSASSVKTKASTKTDKLVKSVPPPRLNSRGGVNKSGQVAQGRETKTDNSNKSNIHQSKDAICDVQNDSKPTSKRKNLKENMNRKQREMSPVCHPPDMDCSEYSAVEEIIPSVSDYETDKMEDIDRKSCGPSGAKDHSVPKHDQSVVESKKGKNVPKSLTSPKVDSKKLPPARSYTKKTSPSSPSLNSRISPGSPKTELKKSPTSPSSAKSGSSGGLKSPKGESRLSKNADSKLPKKAVPKKQQRDFRNLSSLTTLEQRYTAEKLELMRLKIPAEMDFSDVSRPSTREGSVDSRFDDDRWSICSDISSISRASSVSMSSGIRARGSKVPTRMTVPSSRVKAPHSRLASHNSEIRLQHGVKQTNAVSSVSKGLPDNKQIKVKDCGGKKSSVPTGTKKYGSGSKKNSPEEEKTVIKDVNTEKSKLKSDSASLSDKTMLKTDISKSSMCSEWLKGSTPVMPSDTRSGTLNCLDANSLVMIAGEQGIEGHFPVKVSETLIEKQEVSSAVLDKNNFPILGSSALTACIGVGEIVSDSSLPADSVQDCASKDRNVNTASDTNKHQLHSHRETDTYYNEESVEEGQYGAISPTNQVITTALTNEEQKGDIPTTNQIIKSTDATNLISMQSGDILSEELVHIDGNGQCNQFSDIGDSSHSDNLWEVTEKKEYLSSETDGQHKHELLPASEVASHTPALPREHHTLSPHADSSLAERGSSDNIHRHSVGSEYTNNKHLHPREGGAQEEIPHPTDITPTPNTLGWGPEDSKKSEMEESSMINVREDGDGFLGECDMLSTLSQVKEIKTEGRGDIQTGVPMAEAEMGEARLSLTEEFMGCDKKGEDFERQFDKNDKISINKPVHISGVSDKPERGCATKTAGSGLHVAYDSSQAQENFDTFQAETETCLANITQGRHGMMISGDIRSGSSHRLEKVQGLGAAHRSGFNSGDVDRNTEGQNSGDTAADGRHQEPTGKQQGSCQLGDVSNEDRINNVSSDEGKAKFINKLSPNLDISCDEACEFRDRVMDSSELTDGKFHSITDQEKKLLTGYGVPTHHQSTFSGAISHDELKPKTLLVEKSHASQQMVPEKHTTILLSTGAQGSSEVISSTDQSRTTLEAEKLQQTAEIQIHVNFNGVGGNAPVCREEKPTDKGPRQKCDSQTLGRIQSGRGDKLSTPPPERRLIIDKRNLHPDGYDENMPIQRKILLNTDSLKSKDFVHASKVVMKDALDSGESQINTAAGKSPTSSVHTSKLVIKDTKMSGLSEKESKQPSNLKLKVTVSKFESQKEGASKPTNRLQTYKPVHKSEFLKQSSVRKSLASRAQQKAITARFSQDSSCIKVNKAKESATVLMKPQLQSGSEKTPRKKQTQSAVPHVSSIEFSLKKDSLDNQRLSASVPAELVTLSSDGESPLETGVCKCETDITGSRSEEINVTTYVTSIDTDSQESGSETGDRRGVTEERREIREDYVENDEISACFVERKEESDVTESANSLMADDNVPVADSLLPLNTLQADAICDSAAETVRPETDCNNKEDENVSVGDDYSFNMERRRTGKSTKIPPTVSPKPKVSVTADGKIDLSYAESPEQLTSLTEKSETQFTLNVQNTEILLDTHNTTVTNVGSEPLTGITESCEVSCCHTDVIAVTSDQHSDNVDSMPTILHTDSTENKLENECPIIPKQIVVTSEAPPEEKSIEMCSFDKSPEVSSPPCPSETVSKQALKRSTGTTSLQRWQTVKNKFLGKPTTKISKEKVNIVPSAHGSVEKTVEEFEVCLEKKPVSKDKSDDKFVDSSRVSEIRRSLSERLAKSPVPETPPATPSPSPTRKYKWIRGEGGIWKKKFLSDSGESGSEAEDYGRENRDETLANLLPVNRCEWNIDRESSSESEHKPAQEGGRHLLRDTTVDNEMETSASEVEDMDVNEQWIKMDTTVKNNVVQQTGENEGVCTEKVDFEAIMQHFNNKVASSCSDGERERGGSVETKYQSKVDEHVREVKSAKKNETVSNKGDDFVCKHGDKDINVSVADSVKHDLLSDVTVGYDTTQMFVQVAMETDVNINERTCHQNENLDTNSQLYSDVITDTEVITNVHSMTNTAEENSIEYSNETSICEKILNDNQPRINLAGNYPKENKSVKTEIENSNSKGDGQTGLKSSTAVLAPICDKTEHSGMEQSKVYNNTGSRGQGGYDNIGTWVVDDSGDRESSHRLDKSCHNVRNDRQQQATLTSLRHNSGASDSGVCNQLELLDSQIITSSDSKSGESYLISAGVEELNSGQIVDINTDKFSPSVCNKSVDGPPLSYNTDRQTDTYPEFMSQPENQKHVDNSAPFKTLTVSRSESSGSINLFDKKTVKDVDTDAIMSEIQEKFIPIEASPFLQKKCVELNSTLELEDQISLSAAESSENISISPACVSETNSVTGRQRQEQDFLEWTDTESELSGYCGGYDTADTTVCDDDLDSTVTDDEPDDLCELVINEDLDDTVVAADGGDGTLDLHVLEDADSKPIKVDPHRESDMAYTSSRGPVRRYSYAGSTVRTSGSSSTETSESGYWSTRKAFWEKDSHELLAEISELEESFETTEEADTSLQRSASASPVKSPDQGGTTPRRLRRKKSGRRSLSLPSGTLSYGDVKITYVDGHFVAEPPDAPEDTKPKTYDRSKRDSVSSGGLQATSSESIADSSGNEDTLSIVSDLALREELLSWLNQHLIDSDVFYSQSLDWNCNHVGSDSSTHSSQSSLAMIPASSTLPRRTGRDNDGNRPVSVDEIQLLRNAYFQEQFESKLNSGSQSHSQSIQDNVSQDPLLSDPRNGRRRLSVQDDKSERSRSKSPNFFQRMLSKRKSFSEKGAKVAPEEGAPRKDTSIVRRMSLKSLFRRKSRKGSDEPESPPIAAFLKDEDIGAVSSLPNSPFISKRVHRVQTEPTIHIRRTVQPSSDQPSVTVPTQSQSQNAPRAGLTRPDVPPRRRQSSSSSMKQSSVTDRSSGEFSIYDYDMGSEDVLTPRSESPSVGDTERDGKQHSGKLVRGEITSNSNDSGIQHDAVLLSSSESLKVSPDSSTPVSIAVKLRKTPSPKQERPKSDITVRWADLLEQVRETGVPYRKDGQQMRKRPRPKSDLEDIMFVDEGVDDEDDDIDVIVADSNGRSRSVSNLTDTGLSEKGGGSTLLTESMRAFGSIGNLRSSDSLRSLRLVDGFQVELRRSSQDVRVLSAKVVKSRRMSTPHPIKNRADKTKSQPQRKAPVMVRSHSMPENLDKLHRRKNFLSLIGADNQSLYSQRSGGDDSSDESEYSVEFTLHDKCPSTRSSQSALATLDETQEEETMTYAEALWDHVTMDPDEMGFRAGDQIRVTDMQDKDWWYGYTEQHRGWFPAAFVRLWVNQERFNEDMIIQDAEETPQIRTHGVNTDQGRANVVNEIIHAEREYVKHLRDVVEGYLKQAKKRPEMFPEEKISIIFGNIEEIYTFATRFLSSLEKAYNKEFPHLSAVGQVFLLHSQSFEIYSDYCNNHPGSGEEVKELYRNKKYRHFFEACRLLQEMIEIPLEGFLLTPVQKICKYHLQLNELLKYTPPDHVDYNHARAALDSMKKIATLINERKRKMESIEKIATWQASVDDWEGDDILQHSSELIYSGELHKINSSGWSQERYFFLFDHQLVYCKKDLLKKNSFCYKGRIDLDHSEIIPVNDGKDAQYNVTVRHSWKVRDTRRDKWYLLVAKSEQVKQRWLKAFEDERKRVKDDQENNFNIPVHLKQTAINNLKQKSHLGKPKAKRKAARSTSLRHTKKPDITYPVSMQTTLPRKKQQDSLGDINQSKKLTWFFLGQGKKK